MPTIIDIVISTIPRIKNRPYGIILWIINCIFPGFGTIIGACFNNCNCIQIIVGISQLFLFSGIVGWILSIYWGYRMYFDFIVYNETLEITRKKIPSQQEKENPGEYSLDKGSINI